MHPPQAAGGERIARTEVPRQVLCTLGLDDLFTGCPSLHLLSNDRLTTMLTAAGSGYVRDGGVALTRWRPDRTLDRDGYSVFVRDAESNALWSLGYEPTRRKPDKYRCEFEPGVVRYRREDCGIESTMEVCVLADDAEVRRCTFRNLGGTPRAIEVTSYLEFVLQDQGADSSHPAFSKLFVETAISPEHSAVFAKRRRASSTDPHRAACHFMVGDSGEGATRFETSRARLLGRGGDLAAPRGIADLSGTSGAVLDPVGCLQRLFLLGPNESACVTFFLAPTDDRRKAEALIERCQDPDRIAEGFETARTAAEQELSTDGLSAADVLGMQDAIARRLYGLPDASSPKDVPSGPKFLERRHLPLTLMQNSVVEQQGGSDAGRLRLDSGEHRCEAGASLAQVDHAEPAAKSSVAAAGPAGDAEELEFFNGLGGFADGGREYVIRLRPEPNGCLRLPPMPWGNVVSNEQAGFVVTETGAGYTWAFNSRENRLTPWQNDPIGDPHSEALYIRDDDSSEFWSAAPGPTPSMGEYEVRHGLGYSAFLHDRSGLRHNYRLFSPRRGTVKIGWLRLTNTGDSRRKLSLFGYCQWALSGGDPGAARNVATAAAAEGVVLATNRRRDPFSDGVAFAALRVTQPEAKYRVTGDREEFLGLHGSLESPRAVASGAALQGRCGQGLDPCAAIETQLVLEPGQAVDCIFLIGETASETDSRGLIERFAQTAAVEAAFEQSRGSWSELAGAVQIETPSRALDTMVNGWLPYQNLSCRLWGRSAYYQSGGAYGFRDQLQDSAAFLLQQPALARQQILLNASHQFVEGDVMHWWHPPHDLGIRTRFSDDLLWLPLFAAEYVQATGDDALWDESAPLLESPQVEPGHAERIVTPSEAGSGATVYEHCCRALDRGLTTGRNGLPLMGCGDWNDGMSRVGIGGQGESVWLGFFIDYILQRMLPVCESRGDRQRAERYAAYRENLRNALNDAGWDGQWYRRAYFDDGTPLGSAASDECKIDALVQAWSVLSGAAPEERARRAVAAVEERLVDEQAGLIRLLHPAIDKMEQDPGYIKGYLPGIRENGGQYTHGVLWFIRALAELGEGDKATRLLEMLTPIRHGDSAEAVEVYQCEPYVIAADVYGVEPHVGRGGWTWYTGSAGWMFRVAVESILGLTMRGGKELRVQPCIAADWPECRLRYRLPDGKTRYTIEIQNPDRRQQGVSAAWADGEPLSLDDGAAVVPLRWDGQAHEVKVRL